MLQYLSESIIVIIIAYVFGIFLLWLLMPFYQTIFSTTTEIKTIFRLPYAVILPVAVLITATLSGAVPAIVLSGISPVKILTGHSIIKIRKNYLRNILTVFQFTISIILICCVIVVQRQIKFVKHKNPGFNEELLLRLDIPNINEKDAQKISVLVGEFRKSPYIKSLQCQPVCRDKYI